MDKTKTSSYDRLRGFSRFRSRSSLFVIAFQYFSFNTANSNQISSSAWLARQLRHKSEEIHWLRRQIRAHQMNLQRANQRVALLVEQLGETLQTASEIDPTPSPANQIFRNLLFNRARGSRTRRCSSKTLIWAQHVSNISPAARNVVRAALSVPSNTLTRSRFHEVRSAVSGTLLDAQ
jgi:1,4-dihydroxy-2-naphthoyl-CoA synthase